MENLTNKKRFVILLCTACVFLIIYMYIGRRIQIKPNKTTSKNGDHHPSIEKHYGHHKSTVKREGHQTALLGGKVDLNVRTNATLTNELKFRRQMYIDQNKEYPLHDGLISRNKTSSAELKNNDTFSKYRLDEQTAYNSFKSFSNSDHTTPNLDSLASASKSSMVLLHQRERYYLGDTVTVQINVKDYQGRPRTTGGDHIRLWATGRGLTGAAGTVVDNGDGTYVGRVTLLWPGNINIKAMVAAQREQLDFIFQNIRQGNTSRQFVGGFTNGFVNETVPCTGSQTLSQELWKSSCNLTSMNKDLPWFCQRPERLSCTSWDFIQANVLPKSEMKAIIFPRVSDRAVIPPGIHVLAEKRKSRDVDPGETKLRSVIPCGRVSPRTTWNVRTPVGYAKNGTWFPTFCSSSFDGSYQATRDCVKGRNMWVIGDSTVRQLFVNMLLKLSLELKTRSWTKPKTTWFSRAEDKEGTFSIVYAVHGLPYNYAYEKTTVKELNASHTYIDSIPAGSRDIVLVHFYMHFQIELPEVLRMCVRQTVSSLKALKQRAPNTTIIVKGPHSFRFVPYLSLGDFWRDIVNDIYREEFSSMLDDVIYLDLWDLTVAVENIDRHPSQNVMDMIMDYCLSLICP